MQKIIFIFKIVITFNRTTFFFFYGIFWRVLNFNLMNYERLGHTIGRGKDWDFLRIIVIALFCFIPY